MTANWVRRKVYNDLGDPYWVAARNADTNGELADYQAFILCDPNGTPYGLSNPIPTGAALVTFLVTRPSIPNNTDTQVIAANPNRKAGSYLVNNTTQTFWLQYEAAAVLNQGVFLVPGGVFKFDTTQEIRAIQNSGGALSLDCFEAE